MGCKKGGKWKQQFEFHSGASLFPFLFLSWHSNLNGVVSKTDIFLSASALDIDWQNNDSFATCSTYDMIYVCKIDKN